MRALAALDRGEQALSGLFCCKTNGDGTFVLNNELHHYHLTMKYIYIWLWVLKYTTVFCKFLCLHVCIFLCLSPVFICLSLIVSLETARVCFAGATAGN